MFETWYHVVSKATTATLGATVVFWYAIFVVFSFYVIHDYFLFFFVMGLNLKKRKEKESI